MFSLIKFLSGFAFWKGDKLGKLIFYGILITIGLTIYHKAFEPKQITKIERQVVEKQVVNNCPDEMKIAGIQINLWKLKFKLGL